MRTTMATRLGADSFTSPRAASGVERAKAEGNDAFQKGDFCQDVGAIIWGIAAVLPRLKLEDLDGALSDDGHSLLN
jgi:hypothetical protein